MLSSVQLYCACSSTSGRHVRDVLMLYAVVGRKAVGGKWGGTVSGDGRQVARRESRYGVIHLTYSHAYCTVDK